MKVRVLVSLACEEGRAWLELGWGEDARLPVMILHNYVTDTPPYLFIPCLKLYPDIPSIYID